MSWLSKAARAVGKVLKPIEKIVGPIVKNTIDSIPGIGPVIVGTHDALKRNVWDVLRRSEGGAGEVVQQIKDGFGNAAQAAATGAEAGLRAQQGGLIFGNTLRNNPALVLGGVGLALLAFGFGRRR